ncbi:SDR family NAD(P)-dependent oxidoreductase [Conexibacter woesei]|uniref:Short-chain dehydrogenase/reductase SDR n=1 Tax=Conexibacter woesei (strain DSM 14684 / CCUG 47730 / CIP 108061 / JCM 11494 / NBRC 100937 / ID131577) TaxID=469383 RepID=D3F703_CONWI|nr:SDR family NAD(P)-dependent oxidoreductase [Conexibacter woesei]ADB52801.1 short-chain dehydrogenase/reductase SDR [Conexibacter woesei DSM 14684]
MKVSLDGKVALVTGASSGIGAEIARTFAEAGADVALVARDPARLDATNAAVTAAGRRAEVVSADLTDDAAPPAVVSAVVERFGQLDVLVNAAGVFEMAPLQESLSGFDRQWQLNVRAPLHLTAAAIPHLRERRGSVLFFSSIGGRVGFASGVGYCASKGAVEQVVRALALEEAPNGVRVNAIAPGNVRTRMNEDLDPEFERAMNALTPLGRFGRVDEIAPMAAFLASDHATYVTGASIGLDGGWTAQ